ncbi:DUF1593 domain-containing protein [Novipirellula artificiosorum]|uniref:DUF1593 domain-containing protein n=1 Tax=Novipirellula artificiosorum TaxID=2528016 RepID=A0A5C6DQ69_9BACT|nr:DUF1593 domain-containing protein [Novipirellula artificiosorum]TWU38314.1 hypothetical protein Poly41_27900 [Novipirellula artificiosorum]
MNTSYFLRRIVGALFFATAWWICLPTDTSAAKPRLVVMTDIGGDPDDEQSIVRFLLYACDLDVEGLCTGFGHGHYKVTHPELLHKAVDAYGQVLPNLLQHREDFPSHDQLKKLIKDGSNGDPHTVGPGRDSEASEWIIRVLDRDDPRPVWFSIWGGPRELAQAIWKVQNTRTAEQLAAFKRKIRVHSIADQDHTAEWIKKNHPDIFWIYSDGQFRGIWKEGDQTIVAPQWLEQNVRTAHGALGPIYPAKAAGKVGVKEGDTPSFFYVLPDGLSDPEHPGWGNWGGRFERSGSGMEFTSASDLREHVPDVLYPVHRWRDAFQNSFAARMDWCVSSFRNANHEPIAVLNGDQTGRVLQIESDANQDVRLSAVGSSDPDGHALQFRWWNYVEAGSHWLAAPLQGSETAETVITIPSNASGQTIHVILEVTDRGEPALTSYRRAILNVGGEPIEPPPGVWLSSAEVVPPLTEFIPAPDGPWVFQRAVNVNGPPVQIDGRQWQGEDSRNFDCNGKALVTKDVKPQPAVDADHTTMLTSFRFSRDLEVSFNRLPVGTYAVFVHVFEDNHSEQLDFFLERHPVTRNYASGTAGHWNRLGPWVARVADGNIVLTSDGGAANLAGIELWKLNETADGKD